MTSQDSSIARQRNEDTGELVPFPLSKRISKIRAVAGRLVDCRSARHADYYRQQVTDALVGQLRKIGLPPHRLEREIRDFWYRVAQEMKRTSPSPPYVDLR